MEEVNLPSPAVKYTRATSLCPYSTWWTLFIHIHTEEDQYSFCNLFPFCHFLPSPFVLLLALSNTVEPKVYVSAGPTALLDGGNESLVATCIAERGRPAAEVFWETELYGRSEKQSQDEPNGTTSVHVHYMWQPQSYALGKKLTCVVRHPTLLTEFRIPYILNVQCKYSNIISPLTPVLSFLTSDRISLVDSIIFCCQQINWSCYFFVTGPSTSIVQKQWTCNTLLYRELLLPF